VARGDRAALTAGLPGELRVRVDGPPGRTPLPDGLRARARYAEDGELRVASTDPPGDLAALLAAGCAPVAVDIRRPDLDDLYRSLAPEAAHAV
jgi:ABC-2 type transport system ATP-binding protein